MKKPGNYLLLLLFSFLFLFWKCDQTDDGFFVEPITIYEKVEGTWRLSRIVMEDNHAKATMVTPNEQNLTTWFDFTTLKLQLLLNEANEPTTFKVQGIAPELFLKEGYWDLSNPFPIPGQPALTIQLYADAAKSDLRDKLVLSSVPGASPDMQVKLQRSANRVVYLTYIIDLIREPEGTN